MGAPLRQWILWSAIVVAVAALGAGAIAWPPGWPWRLLALTSLAAVCVHQAFRRVAAFDPFGRVRSSLPGGQSPWCAITFDDGPCADTARVLDILAVERVPATFFVLGGSVERHPELVQRAHAEGHAIGIHGRDHRKLASASESVIEEQVTGLAQQLRALGIEPAPIYRTPHGQKSSAVFSVARRHGLTLWAWSRGVWDTDRPSPRVLVSRSTRFARSGMVLLLHDGRGDEPAPDISSMVAALPSVVRELKARGFSFVRLSDVPAS